MAAQGSSAASLQYQIMSLINNTGGFEQGRLLTPVHTHQTTVSARNTEYQDDAQLRERMVEISEMLKREMEKVNTDIEFDYNEEIKSLVVTVREATTQRVIREIPSAEAIELVRKVRDIVGNIFDTHA